MNEQVVDPYRPIKSSRVGPAPLVVRIVTTSGVDHLVGGVPQSTTRSEPYVLLSALPQELRQRVELAIQTLATAQ